MARLRSATALLIVLMLGLLGLSACGSGGPGGKSEEAGGPPRISVRDGAEDVDPRDPVTVTADGSDLTRVVMTNETGYEVESRFTDGRRGWTTDEILGYHRTYTLEAEDAEGHTATATFSTLAPDATASAVISPVDGATVGVGEPVAVRFSVPVQDREAAQKAIHITTEPEVEGAFFWVNAFEVRWRPEDYWEAGTKVTVKADIYGRKLGGGYYGESDVSSSFTVGDRVISIVDDETKTMTVYRNRKRLRTMPVSLGSATYPTPNGVYIVAGMYPSIVMDSETFGLPHDQGGYKLDVKWATQISYSGIFVHSAPWSVWAQGEQNTSHGCVNVSPDNAEWYQEISTPGDLVIVRNTDGGTLDGYDGLGDWNIPWSTWKAGNADEAD